MNFEIMVKIKIIMLSEALLCRKIFMNLGYKYNLLSSHETALNIKIDVQE